MIIDQICYYVRLFKDARGVEEDEYSDEIVKICKLMCMVPLEENQNKVQSFLDYFLKCDTDNHMFT